LRGSWKPEHSIPCGCYIRVYYPALPLGAAVRPVLVYYTSILYCAVRRVIFTAFHRGFSYSDEPHAVKNIYIYIYINDIESDYPASRPSRLQYERRVISRPGYELSLMIIYDGSNAPDYTNLTPADKNPSNRAFRLERKTGRRERESTGSGKPGRERQKRNTRCACRCVTAGDILRKLTGLRVSVKSSFACLCDGEEG